jgi:RNA polymerase sigma-70 factor (ECF subfamily)
MPFCVEIENQALVGAASSESICIAADSTRPDETRFRHPCDNSRDLEDKAMMRRVQDGDLAALGILFDRYSGVVFGVAKRILRDPTEAQDTVQDVFLYVLRRGCLFDPARGTVATWVLQVTYSTSFNRLKRHKVRLSARHVSIDAASHIADPGMGPERTTERICAGQIVRLALTELTEAQRETLCLYFFEGHSLLEISIKRNETLGNTRHHYHRGIERLRRVVAEEPQAIRNSNR